MHRTAFLNRFRSTVDGRLIASSGRTHEQDHLCRPRHVFVLPPRDRVDAFLIRSERSAKAQLRHYSSSSSSHSQSSIVSPQILQQRSSSSSGSRPSSSGSNLALTLSLESTESSFLLRVREMNGFHGQLREAVSAAYRAA